MRRFRDWLARDGEAPRPAMEIGDIHAIKTLVGAGAGASILPSDALGFEAKRGEVVLRPLAPSVGLAIGLVQRRDKPEDPALAVVRAALMGLAKAKRPGPAR